jgi:hypothetical protein
MKITGVNEYSFDSIKQLRALKSFCDKRENQLLTKERELVTRAILNGTSDTSWYYTVSIIHSCDINGKWTRRKLQYTLTERNGIKLPYTLRRKGNTCDLILQQELEYQAGIIEVLISNSEGIPIISRMVRVDSEERYKTIRLF